MHAWAHKIYISESSEDTNQIIFQRSSDNQLIQSMAAVSSEYFHH